jgi:ribonuclease P protein component
MFKKENRLVPGVRFGNSHLVISPQFILKEKENNLNVNRFGIVVSKKIDKRAVGRNRVKRFFRTTLMDLYGKMNTGHDILFIIRKEILGKTKEENSLAIENALGKAGIIKK